MGSVRNPVGPLPSSIYWRRRAVVLLLLALLTVLAVWAVNSREGGGNSANGPDGRSPAPSITPGPSASGPLNSSRPGGSVGGGGGDDGGGGDATDGGAGDSGATDGSSQGADSGATDGGADAAAAGTGGSGGSGSGGAQLPAGSSLPDCGPGVSLSVRSTDNAYEPGERPRFTLTATNPSATACKLDFGPDSAVFSITDVNDRHVWASDDCPKSRAPYLLQVPAGGSTSYDVEWDRRTSSPKCATPKGRTAPYGTYLLEVKLPGRSAKQTSFVLKNV
ncbi:hypothetical protein [Actinacidiphila sp. bgisy160]|uniref:hypothetical protein n=1 Tax=Actinacidiphila sp. bgisy160 TaxID=3413796 RepID=UPI003D71C1FB